MERSDIDTLKTQMSRVLHELNEQEKRVEVLEKKEKSDDDRVKIDQKALVVDDIFSFRRIILKQGDFNIMIESEQYDDDIEVYYLWFHKNGEELHSVTHYNKEE